MYLLPHSVAWPESAAVAAPRARAQPEAASAPLRVQPQPAAAIAPVAAAETSRRDRIVIEVSVEQVLVALGFAALVAWVLALQARVARLARLVKGG